MIWQEEKGIMGRGWLDKTREGEGSVFVSLPFDYSYSVLSLVFPPLWSIIWIFKKHSQKYYIVNKNKYMILLVNRT